MDTTQTYAVYTCNDSSADAETNLSAADVVRHIYRDDGADYRLEPKIITNRFDDEDNELPDTQDMMNNGNLVFDVYFKHNDSNPWRKSHRTAIGKNQDEAEEAFLQQSFDRTMWNDSRWIVITTNQYQFEQFENAAQADNSDSDE